MRYTSRLVNENANNRLAVRPGDLRMHQFEPVVDGNSVGDLPNSLFNRPGAHCGLRKSTRPKEKVGANPPDETAVLRASCELYGKGLAYATCGRARLWFSLSFH